MNENLLEKLAKLQTFIQGKGERITENTPTGYRSSYKQYEPDILGKLANLFSGKSMTPATPSPSPQVLSAYAPSPSAYTPEKTGPGFTEPMGQMNTPIPQSTAVPGGLARNPSISKFKIDPGVADAITKAATQYGLPPSLLFDIALQESSFNPNLTNTTPEGIQAGNPKGLFQFTDPTWQTVNNYANMQGSSLSLPNQNRFDPQTNALAAAYLISKGQLGRWDASKDVWGKFYKPEEIQPYYAQTLGMR